KLQRSSKHQASAPAPVEGWLELLWSLVLGAWCFSRICSRHPVSSRDRRFQTGSGRGDRQRPVPGLSFGGIRHHAATHAARVLETPGPKDATKTRRGDSRGAGRAFSRLFGEELWRRHEWRSDFIRCGANPEYSGVGSRRPETGGPIWLPWLSQSPNQDRWAGL